MMGEIARLPPRKVPDHVGKSFVLAFFPLSENGMAQLATALLQDRRELATLTMYRGSNPVASSRLTVNDVVDNSSDPRIAKGKRAKGMIASISAI
jgi:hypothetical protein